MNKREVFEILRDRNWNYYHKDEKGGLVLIYINGKHSDWSYIILRFEEDGTITFPIDLGFNPPETRFWDFDESKNEIVLYNENHEEHVRANLPVIGFHGEQEMKLITNEDLYSTTPHANKRVIRDYIFGGQRMFFYDTDKVTTDIYHDLNEKDGYNIFPVNMNGDIISIFKQIEKYISEHGQLKEVFISMNEELKINKAPMNKLYVAFNPAISAKLERFGGERSVVLEFLNEVLIEDNKRLLANQTDLSTDRMINQVLQETFKDRYVTE